MLIMFVLRRCGKDKPVMEVTNRLLPSRDSDLIVDPDFL